MINKKALLLNPDRLTESNRRKADRFTVTESQSDSLTDTDRLISTDSPRGPPIGYIDIFWVISTVDICRYLSMVVAFFLNVDFDVDFSRYF